MELTLENPLVFVNIETADPTKLSADRIVEITMLRINLDKSKDRMSMLLNPEMKISEEMTAKHGITNEMVSNQPKFVDIAEHLVDFFYNCDFAGYNLNRSVLPILSEELLRANEKIDLKEYFLIDLQALFLKMEKRNLTAAYKFYCGKDLNDAHTALADTRATYEVLKGQLDYYKDKEITEGNKTYKPVVNDIAKLAEFSKANNNVDFAGRIVRNDKGVEVFNFGKHKGKAVEKILEDEPGYYAWMMDGEFSRHTKKILTDIKLRAFRNKFK